MERCCRSHEYFRYKRHCLPYFSLDSLHPLSFQFSGPCPVKPPPAVPNVPRCPKMSESPPRNLPRTSPFLSRSPGANTHLSFPLSFFPDRRSPVWTRPHQIHHTHRSRSGQELQIPQFFQTPPHLLNSHRKRPHMFRPMLLHFKNTLLHHRHEHIGRTAALIHLKTLFQTVAPDPFPLQMQNSCLGQARQRFMKTLNHQICPTLHCRLRKISGSKRKMRTMGLIHDQRNIPWHVPHPQFPGYPKPHRHKSETQSEHHEFPDVHLISFPHLLVLSRPESPIFL